MDKNTLKETLKSNAMRFTLAEIEEMMDDELNKPVEEMDTELIDLCVDILTKAYNAEEQKKCAENKRKNRKTTTIKKILLVAAVVGVFLTLSFSIASKEMKIDASGEIVSWSDKWYHTDFTKAKTRAIKHSDSNVDIIRQLNGMGIKNVILPSVLLSDKYERYISYIDEQEAFLTIRVDIKNKTNNNSMCVYITEMRDPEWEEGMKKYGSVSGMFNNVKQLTVNGMDILIFSNEETIVAEYIDNNISYSFDSTTCNLKSTIEIMNSLK